MTLTSASGRTTVFSGRSLQIVADAFPAEIDRISMRDLTPAGLSAHWGIHSSSWQIVQALLADQRFAVLATQGGDAPYTSLVAFAVTPGLRRLMFPTRAGTRKFANLEANPRVALLVDNRSNSAEDYRNAAALTVIGTVGVEHGPQEDQHRELLLDRHPTLAGFLAQPDCRIAVVDVAEYRLVTQFEAVVRLDPNDRSEAP